MLFTKWRFLFNIDSNSRNPSFVKVDLREGPAAMRGFLRFKHDLSESASHQIPDRQYSHLIRCGYGGVCASIPSAHLTRISTRAFQ